MKITKRVRFIRNFTIEPIELLLKRDLLADQIIADCTYGGFATSAEEVLRLGDAGDDLLVLALGLELSSPDFGHVGWDVKAACDQILLVAREAVERFRGLIVLNTVLAPLHGMPLGVAADPPQSAESLVDALNVQLRELVQTDPTRIALADWTRYARQLGDRDTYDRRFWLSSGAPFRARFLALYAKDIAAVLRISVGRVRKCLVLDCDNTLWGGVVGEDGINGIRLSDSELPGAYFRNFQKSILDLHARGVAIALASKNNEADVLDVLQRHPHMLVRREHLSAWRVNWDDKPVSLMAIAAELNLGLDSLVFVDDSSFECEMVGKALPQVRVLQAPASGEELVSLLERHDPFEAMTVTAADRARNATYLENRQRAEFSVAVGDLAEFKRRINAKLRVRRACEIDQPRILQLLQRTNQFNLTTRRHTSEQLREMLADSGTMILCAELRDRFGDLGLVGVAIARRRGECAIIDSLLMSCRALGRDAELAFAAALIASIRNAWHPRWIEAEYVPSEKNAMVADFWTRTGFARTTDDASQGAAEFRANADEIALVMRAPEHVTLMVEP